MDENEGIVFDELPSAAEDNFIQESDEEVDDDELNGEESDEEHDSKTKASIDEDDLEFTTTMNASLVPNLRKTMKAKSRAPPESCEVQAFHLTTITAKEEMEGK